MAVISNGTAVLGLGNIGALAGKPVMEGKGVLFKKFAGIDVFDIEVDELDPDKFIEVVAALEPGHDEYNCYHEIGLPKNIDGKLLDGAIAIIEKGEESVKRNSDIDASEKDVLLRRLARVKLTPVWMKWKFFKEFYPDAGIEEEKAFADYVLNLREYAGVKYMSETVELEQFVKVRYESTRP